MTKNILLGVNLLLVLAIGAYLFLNKPQQKSAYVLNAKLFEGFSGKADLEKKLGRLRNENKKKIDSLVVLMESGKNNPTLMQFYSETIETYRLTEKQISGTYTSDIWKRLNEYIADYGKQEGYDFIFGASGEGNLMYADDSRDVTEAVTQYANERYIKGD